MNKQQIDDARRGVLWEEKWRGTLSDHTAPGSLDHRADYWLKEAENVVPEGCIAGWPKGRVGLGTYGWKYRPEVIEEALYQNVPIIDTAEGYGFGRVETELGKILRRYPDAPTWVASKVSRNHGSKSAATNAARRSRDKLGRPIDLYQIHWPVFSKIEETLDAFAVLLEEGTIKRVGVCNFCAGQLSRAMSLAKARGFQIESNQIRLNLNDPGSAEYLVPFCNRVGVRVLAYSPLAQGKLARRAGEALSWVVSQPIQYALPRANSVGHLTSNLLCG